MSYIIAGHQSATQENGASHKKVDCCLPPMNELTLNVQIINLLVPLRAAGVAGTLIFVHIANFATLQPWLHVGSFTCRIFNSLHTHKGPVLYVPLRDTELCD